MKFNTGCYKFIMGLLIIVAQMNCGEPVTSSDGGLFFSNISGNYTLTEVSDVCISDFSPAIQIQQDVHNLIVKDKTSGFSGGGTGTIDEDDSIQIDGRNGDGIAFSCNGLYVEKQLAGVCDIEDRSCSLIYKKN